jgi:hypothetical protein
MSHTAGRQEQREMLGNADGIGVWGNRINLAMTIRCLTFSGDGTLSGAAVVAVIPSPLLSF